MVYEPLEDKLNHLPINCYYAKTPPMVQLVQDRNGRSLFLLASQMNEVRADLRQVNVLMHCIIP
jgi:hypothetical protein